MSYRHFVSTDRPGPPEGPLEASDVMADSCKLSWKPPKDDGGSRVTNYIVEMKVRSNIQFVQIKLSVHLI